MIRRKLPSRHSSAPDSSSSDKPPINILALIESAKGLSDLSSICKATPYLSGLILGAEDFAFDLSITRTPSLSEFLYARSAIATACRAHNLPSTIDLVCTSYKDEAGQRTLKEECLGGKSLGFNGKQLIHPSQVEIAQRAFNPSNEEIDWAVKVLLGDKEADRQGRGAWSLDGRMIDVPVVEKAKSIIKKAEDYGWKDEEPE